MCRAITLCWETLWPPQFPALWLTASQELISRAAGKSGAADPVAMATPAGVPERNDKAKGLKLPFSPFGQVSK